MKYFILFTSVLLVCCSSNSNDFILIETGQATNNNFTFNLDCEDNLIRILGGNSSNFYMQNWDFKEHKPANELISIYFDNTDFYFFSETYKIDSIEMIGYNFEQSASFNDSCLFIYYPDIHSFVDLDTDIKFKMFFTYKSVFLPQEESILKINQ